MTIVEIAKKQFSGVYRKIIVPIIIFNPNRIYAKKARLRCRAWLLLILL